MKKKFNGIDVSSWQGNIDWTKVSKQVDFAIIRAGFGKNNIDKKAMQNIRGCEENNVPYGLYWFSYAYTVEMAQKEAQYFLSFIKGHIPLLPLYFDFEGDSTRFAKQNGVQVTKELLSAMATAFCEELESAGYYAGIYSNLDYIKNRYNSDIFDKYDLWYARWGLPEPDRNVHLWQYTSDGKINGISGRVDLNKAYIDFPALIKSKGLNKSKSEEKICCPFGYDCPYKQ